MGERSATQIDAEIRFLEKTRDKLRDDVERVAKAKRQEIEEYVRLTSQSRTYLDSLNAAIKVALKKLRAINETIAKKIELTDAYVEGRLEIKKK